MSIRLALIIAIVSTNTLLGQNVIDFREQTNVRVEHRLTQDFSMTMMGAVILTKNFKELGFAYLDAGVGYKINANFGINGNYRMLFRQNLNQSYERRHVLYADLDYSKGLDGPWTVTATLRLQGQFFNNLLSEAPRPPSFYARSRIGLRYKINYYWQPFVESELFTPMFRPARPYPDQLRYSLGISYSFNRYSRVEFYEQFQRQYNTASDNFFFLTAINWGLRF